MRDLLEGRLLRRAAAAFAATVLAAALVAVAAAMPAGAASSVDLSTALLQCAGLSGARRARHHLRVAVNNASATVATNVVADVVIPAGATVVDLYDNCSTSGSHVTCTWPTVAMNIGPGRGHLSDVRFDRHEDDHVQRNRQTNPNIGGNSAASLDINVVSENADLAGTNENARVALGTQSTYRVGHQFDNKGPTAAADAAVTGTVTGGTIVPGSFNFFTNYFTTPNRNGNLAASDCTVTATTFSCAPVFSGGVFDAPQPFVFYDVMLPTTPGTVVATATLTGRADPVSSNNSSTFTIDVAEPATELVASIESPGVVASGQPFVLTAVIEGGGEIPAQQPVATLTVPDDWGIALSPNPPPSGVVCAVLTSPHALRCTRDTMPSDQTWEVQATVTPPAGAGTGTATFDVTTTTPEIGTFPDSASLDIRYTPNAGAHLLSVTPDMNLQDGDAVTVAGVGFTPGAEIFFCEGITAPVQVCGTNQSSTTADADGSFSANVNVARFLVVRNVGVIDCARPNASCAIGVLDSGSSSGAVAAPLSFTAQPPVENPFNAHITGRVTDAAGNRVAGALVWAYRPGDTWVASLQTVTDASGDYVFDDPEPGISYRITFAPPAGSQLVRQWYDGTPAGSPTRAKRASGVAQRAGADRDGRCGAGRGRQSRRNRDRTRWDARRQRARQGIPRRGQLGRPVCRHDGRQRRLSLRRRRSRYTNTNFVRAAGGLRAGPRVVRQRRDAHHRDTGDCQRRGDRHCGRVACAATVTRQRRPTT